VLTAAELVGSDSTLVLSALTDLDLELANPELVSSELGSQKSELVDFGLALVESDYELVPSLEA